MGVIEIICSTNNEMNETLNESLESENGVVCEVIS